MLAYVTGADEQDRDAAEDLLVDLKKERPDVVHLWVDRGYRGELIDWAREQLGVTLEVVGHTGRGFVLEAKRWIVERTISWLGKCRRLAKDYEEHPETSEAWIYVAMLRLMVRRLAPKTTTKAPAC